MFFLVAGGDATIRLASPKYESNAQLHPLEVNIATNGSLADRATQFHRPC
jgi:hypothetical protein